MVSYTQTVATKPLSVSATIREAVEKASVTRYQIAKETGISEATLCRFAQGGSLKLETLDKLAEYFGLGLLPVHKNA